MSPEVRTSDGVRLHVEETGAAGSPTVVLAHGWALGISTWDGVADELATRGLRVIRYDQRGHGRSERGDLATLTLPRLGLDLADVVEQTGPDPVVLVGHSMGGMSIMAMARQRPDLIGAKVTGVVLVNTSAGELKDVGLLMPKVLRPIAARSITPVMAHVHTRTQDKSRGVLVRIADRLTKRSSFGSAADAAQVAAARQLIAATDPDVIRTCSQAMAEHDELAALAELRRTSVRVLAGSRDVLTPLAHARRIAEESHARLVVVPDAGHMLHIEAPDVVVEEVMTVARERLVV